MKLIKLSDVFRRFANMLDDKDKVPLIEAGDPGQLKLAHLHKLAVGYARIVCGVDVNKGKTITAGRSKSTEFTRQCGWAVNHPRFLLGRCAMRVGNFSVQVPEGKERESGHVLLDHNTQYVLRLGNHCYDRRCDAVVTIDGKDIGGYRINPGSSIVLERSSHDTGRFTFFRSDSAEAGQAGAGGVATQDRGLVRVVFKPERRRDREEKTSGVVPSSLNMLRARGMDFPKSSGVSGQNASEGVTGLTGRSDQQFYEVPNLDYDPLEETVINIRLVAGQGVRELKPVAKSNPVPESVK